jgi:3-oxoacyl-[acyl-carrier protein] reductase
VSDELQGRVALVTGGARGIGLACARAIAGRGAAVALIDVLDAEPAAAQLRAAGAAARAYRLDVTDRGAVGATFGAIEAELGSLDILVCAAGIYGETTKLEELEEAEVGRLLAVNIEGPLWCLQAGMAAMLRSGWGRVVFIGSVAGQVGGVLAGPHYAASKGAVHAIVKWAARAGAAHGVQVNGVAPGAVATDMIVGKDYSPDYCPLGRIAEPDEIGSVVGFLVSPGASYMTGQVVGVNGGYVL